MTQKYSIRGEEQRKTVIEGHKQRILALNNRLKRYTTREKQYEHNKMFHEKPDVFYKELRGNNIAVLETTNK